MTGSASPHDGRVLVGVKAKPSGWPTASPDPDSGRDPLATARKPDQVRQRGPRPKITSSRFQGIATGSSAPPWQLVVQVGPPHRVPPPSLPVAAPPFQTSDRGAGAPIGLPSEVPRRSP